MRPVLFELGPLKVHAYGLALALSFLAGSIWMTRAGRRRGFGEEDLSRLFFWLLAAALIGSRVYFAIQHPGDFDRDWTALFQIWRGGLSQHGGVIGAVAIGALFARSRGWSFRELADLAAPALAFGEALTRILGCFLAGCCHGVPCALPWAVHYPEGSPAFDLWNGAGVHPSPVYLAIGNFALAAVLVRYSERWIGTGKLFALFLAGSGALRFLVDLTRYYTQGDWITLLGLRLSHSQWMAIAMIALAAWLWWKPRHAPAQKNAQEMREARLQQERR
ncbi:MAG: prolipoprotein diacylglyceryl transferase [Candidatus Eisenbacteria bacterium]|nr:prolipoprotein diacylglyceryl transferase [Candidatus Eisenbacteria bacterium]